MMLIRNESSTVRSHEQLRVLIFAVRQGRHDHVRVGVKKGLYPIITFLLRPDSLLLLLRTTQLVEIAAKFV